MLAGYSRPEQAPSPPVRAQIAVLAAPTEGRHEPLVLRGTAGCRRAMGDDWPVAIPLRDEPSGAFDATPLRLTPPPSGIGVCRELFSDPEVRIDRGGGSKDFQQFAVCPGGADEAGAVPPAERSEDSVPCRRPARARLITDEIPGWDQEFANTGSSSDELSVSSSESIVLPKKGTRCASSSGTALSTDLPNRPS